VGHEREQRNGHQQVAIQLAEDDLADRTQAALGGDQQRAAEQRQPGEDGNAREQKQYQAGEDQCDRQSPSS